MIDDFNDPHAGSGIVTIRIAKPVAPQRIPASAAIVPLEHFDFSRGEWAVLVMSGLWAAIKACGWSTWDIATSLRSAGVSEKDHLMATAGLLSQGGVMGEWICAGGASDWRSPREWYAARALRQLGEAAKAWRQQEGIETPLRVFPTGDVLMADRMNPPRRWDPPVYRPPITDEQAETLVDLAEQRDEATFKDLARALGVPAERVDEFWTETTKRVRTR